MVILCYGVSETSGSDILLLNTLDHQSGSGRLQNQEKH